MIKDRFIVIKDFYKFGSVVIEYDKSQQRLYMGDSAVLRNIAKSPIQVVVMGGKDALDIYSEYQPYIKKTPAEFEEVYNMVVSGNIPGEINPFVPHSPYRNLLPPEKRFTPKGYHSEDYIFTDNLPIV